MSLLHILVVLILFFKVHRTCTKVYPTCCFSVLNKQSRTIHLFYSYATKPCMYMFSFCRHIHSKIQKKFGRFTDTQKLHVNSNNTAFLAQYFRINLEFFLFDFEWNRGKIPLLLKLASSHSHDILSALTRHYSINQNNFNPSTITKSHDYMSHDYDVT